MPLHHLGTFKSVTANSYVGTLHFLGWIWCKFWEQEILRIFLFVGLCIPSVSKVEKKFSFFKKKNRFLVFEHFFVKMFKGNFLKPFTFLAKEKPTNSTLLFGIPCSAAPPSAAQRIQTYQMMTPLCAPSVCTYAFNDPRCTHMKNVICVNPENVFAICLATNVQEYLARNHRMHNDNEIQCHF